MLVSTFTTATAFAHPTVDPGPATAPTSALSTNGDYASDMFGDPWDFSNEEDVPDIKLAGCENCNGIALSGGWINVNTVNQSTIKLIRTWGAELPWGRDGRLHPANAGVYKRLSFSGCIDGIPGTSIMNMGVHFFTDTGVEGLMAFQMNGGCKEYDLDMGNAAQYLVPSKQAVWGGQVIRLEILRGGPGNFTPPNPALNIRLDWARLHRADAPAQPTAAIPVPQVLTPNEVGGADYATSNGNPFDMNSSADALDLHQMDTVNWSNGELSAWTNSNDPYVEFPLRSPFNTDRYHRFTADVCYGGAREVEFGNFPGGGMVARVAWFSPLTGRWTETQDIIIYPGCHTMTMDLSTSPAVAVNDENTVAKIGWRGVPVSRLRFDLNEDPGRRQFWLRDIKFADDAAFSGTYPITFKNAAGTPNTTAEVFVTTTRGAFDGTKVGQVNVPADANAVTTFNWNGNDASGNAMPNGTYWVYVVMRNGGNVGTNIANGPLRLEKPVSATPACFTPVSPTRVLDTRTGQGGNIVALAGGATTEMGVAGVSGLPATGIQAVVMNITVADTFADGYITAWPSGEGQPGVSNVNFAPGQTRSNLSTVKIGANGKVNLFNSAGVTNLIVDVMGYYGSCASTSGGGRFTAVTPSRVLDTRDGTGARKGPIGPNGTIDFGVLNVGGVPASGVTAVALNVTLDQPTGNGYLSVWPGGEGWPGTSTHNFTPGRTVANLVIVKVGANGRVNVLNSAGSSNVIADVVGYYSGNGKAFVPISPQRIADSRTGPQLSGPLVAGGTVAVSLAGYGPVPGNAASVVLNVTSTDAAVQTFITVWPNGVGRPNASTVNPLPGGAVPNHAYLKVGADGKLAVYLDSGYSNVIVDVFGYMV